jgi:hypothetical protein
MFLPQVAELDIYLDGQQVDDINSTLELIEQQVLQIPDNSPEDEDGDNGQNLNLAGFAFEAQEVNFQQSGLRNFSTNTVNEFLDRSKIKLIIRTLDIPLPPPKATSINV